MVPADEYRRLLKTREESVRRSTDTKPEVPNTTTPFETPPSPTTPPPPTASQMSDELALLAVPQKFRSKAGRLLKFMDEKLTWNSKGELLKEDGSALQGSHIGDLLKDLYYTYKKEHLTGRTYFKDKLDSEHAPKCLLGRGVTEQTLSEKRGLSSQRRRTERPDKKKKNTNAKWLNY